jgi:hypothetical protein
VSTPANFFAVRPDEVKREDGNPMLIPRGLESTGTRVRYTRASGLADFISEQAFFHLWEMRYLAMGIARNPDLAGMAAVETYNTGILHPAFGSQKTASGRRLDDIIRKALDRVGIHEKADWGTAVHGFTEPGAPAVPVWQGPWGQMGPDVASFEEWNAAYGVRILDTERFIANDAIMGAGTFDHTVEVPGHPLLTGHVIADKKTGKYEPHHWAVQLAVYANGEPYEPDDTRPGWPAGEVNLKWGLVWQIREGKTVGHMLDLEVGWEAAQRAAWVRDFHGRTDLASPFKPATFVDRLGACNDRDSLVWLWHITADAERAAVEEKARTLP